MLLQSLQKEPIPLTLSDLGLPSFRTMRRQVSVVEATQSVVLCYSSPGKLIQGLSSSHPKPSHVLPLYLPLHLANSSLAWMSPPQVKALSHNHIAAHGSHVVPYTPLCNSLICPSPRPDCELLRDTQHSVNTCFGQGC